MHELRHRFMAILVGIGTAVADDPLLNCRIEGRGVRQPIRVVVDSNARLSLDSQLVKTAGEYRTIVAHTRFAPEESVKAFAGSGCGDVTLQGEGRTCGCQELVGIVGAVWN